MMKWFLCVLLTLVLSACTPRVKVEYRTQIVERFVTKEVPKVILPNKKLFKCTKPQKIEDMVDLNNVSEDDLYSLFERSYLNHIECYKSIKNIESFITKAKKVYEGK